MSHDKLREAANKGARMLRVAVGAFERNDCIDWQELEDAAVSIEAALAATADAPKRDDDKPLAEDTDTICAEILKTLQVGGHPSFDLLNCVAAYAMRCEEDGRSFQRLIDKTTSLEVKTGFKPDRRVAAPPSTNSGEVVNKLVVGINMDAPPIEPTVDECAMHQKVHDVAELEKDDD